MGFWGGLEGFFGFFVLHVHPQSMLQEDKGNLRVTGVNCEWDPWPGDWSLCRGNNRCKRDGKREEDCEQLNIYRGELRG